MMRQVSSKQPLSELNASCAREIAQPETSPDRAEPWVVLIQQL
jgi:hypothetical protein